MEDIKVYVIKRPNRRNLMLRYLDPLTGKHVSKSAGTHLKSKAEKEAGAWEAELKAGTYAPPSKWRWKDFREFYEANGLPGVALSSARTYEATLNVFERLTNPQRLADVTTARVTAFVAKLREQKLAEATVARHLRHLKAIMRWARKQGIVHKIPEFHMPKRVKGAKVMRGRPITGEEFDRMIGKVEAVDDCKADPDAWKFYLRGLWLSGLRLSESLTLSWEPKPGAIVVDLGGKYPMLRIPAEAEKGGRDRTLPITPDFAEHLQGVPEGLRRGRVFRVGDSRYEVGPVVSAIGKAAGVVVDERQQGEKLTRKYASAHDLRRAFGTRWSRRVMPTVLRELMRHSSVATTMAYYVESDAEATARELWGDQKGNGNPHGDHLGDHRKKQRGKKQGEKRKNPRKAGV